MVPWQVPICIFILILNAAFFTWIARLAPSERGEALRQTAPIFLVEGGVVLIVSLSLLFSP